MVEESPDRLREGGPRFPSRDDVLAEMRRRINPSDELSVIKERSDGLGLYLLEARTPGSGETYTLFDYVRAGTHEEGYSSRMTSISRTDYVNGAVEGFPNECAVYDSAEGVWH